MRTDRVVRRGTLQKTASMDALMSAPPLPEPPPSVGIMLQPRRASQSVDFMIEKRIIDDNDEDDHAAGLPIALPTPKVRRSQLPDRWTSDTTDIDRQFAQLSVNSSPTSPMITADTTQKQNVMNTSDDISDHPAIKQHQQQPNSSSKIGGSLRKIMQSIESRPSSRESVQSTKTTDEQRQQRPIILRRFVRNNTNSVRLNGNYETTFTTTTLVDNDDISVAPTTTGTVIFDFN
jgi:hypothetical protein